MSKRVLSLFSGIGLLDLGLAWAGFQTVGLCEIDPYCRSVLRKHWPGVPIWSDVRVVTGDAVRQRCGAVDLVAGGVPCQPFSSASRGRKHGVADDRWLWPEMLRVAHECRAAWVLLENVAHIDGVALKQVASDLETGGWEVGCLEIPACAVGLDHWRPRYWILGYSNGYRQPVRAVDAEAPKLPWRGGQPGNMAQADGGTAKLAGRMMQLKAIGNGVVPQVVAEVGRAIIAAEAGLV